jgi:hypothetical protein
MGWGKQRPHGSECVCGRGPVVNDKGCLMCGLDWNDAVIAAQKREEAEQKRREAEGERLYQALETEH